MTNTHPYRRAAVLGHPVSHSLSPALHRAAYAALGLTWDYDAIDLTADQLPHFIDDLGDEWAGLSVTMPLKEAVLPLLSEVDPLARRLRSVNTVLFSELGRTGYNTDVYGLAKTIDGMGDGPPESVTIIGAGATARSAVAALAQLPVDGLVVSARRPAAAEQLAALSADFGLACETTKWPPAPQVLAAELVISTVPLAASSPLLAQLPATPRQLLDVLYDPWPTPLSAAWSAAGGLAVGGLELLVHQAVEQLRLMTGSRVDPAILRAAGLSELDRRHIAQAEQ